MDSITHITLGAVIGEGLLGKKLGKRALFLGAVAQSLPDIDFVASFWLPPADDLLAHRGFTHSLLFAAIASFTLALVAERWHRPHNISLKKWIFFFGIQILIHLLIDSLNAYGIGWFEPFSHHRFSFHTIFVADPFYSLWLGIAFMALLVLTRKNPLRKKWMAFGLITSTCYLLYTGYNKLMIDHEVKRIFDKQQIAHNRYFTTPTALNNWLWYVVAEDDSGYHIGYRSVFDERDTIDFHYFQRNEKLLNPVHDDEELQKLKRFSQNYYTVEYWGDTLVFNDLRFGQIIGWHDPNEKFVFHYFLQRPSSNALVIQRGRFAKWNWPIVKSLVKRIRGD